MSGDFAETQEYVTEDSYVFLDPPYRGCFTQYGVDFDDKIQQSVIDYLNQATSKGAYVTYTAGRRKKNEDGTHSAKKAREILMIGVE